jgi:hypothetical protein
LVSNTNILVVISPPQPLTVGSLGLGGGFCPVVNLWFPMPIVDDLIAASDPRTPPLFTDLRRMPRHGLVLVFPTRDY